MKFLQSKYLQLALAAGIMAVTLIGVTVALDRYVTALDILQLNQNAIRDSSSTTRINLGATNTITGNLSVSGVTSPTTLQIVSSTAPRDTSSSVGITPTAAGQLVFNSTDNELCLSTGTTRFTWVRVSSGTATTACAH